MTGFGDASRPAGDHVPGSDQESGGRGFTSSSLFPPQWNCLILCRCKINRPSVDRLSFRQILLYAGQLGFILLVNQQTVNNYILTNFRQANAI